MWNCSSWQVTVARQDMAVYKHSVHVVQKRRKVYDKQQVKYRQSQTLSECTTTTITTTNSSSKHCVRHVCETTCCTHTEKHIFKRFQNICSQNRQYHQLYTNEATKLSSVTIGKNPVRAKSERFAHVQTANVASCKYVRVIYKWFCL